LKTIIIACGAGVATSTVITSYVTQLLRDNNIEHRIIQCSLNEVRMHIDKGDLLVTSMPLKEKYDIPTVLGISFLTGVEVSKTMEDIVSYLGN
jgi:PTS system galactitol-specific IIB component